MCFSTFSSSGSTVGGGHSAADLGSIVRAVDSAIAQLRIALAHGDPDRAGRMTTTPCGRCGGSGTYQAQCPACENGRTATGEYELCGSSGSEPVPYAAA